MIRSMTAFADGEKTIGNQVLLCELRTVNHRYADIFVKLPERLRFAELEIRRQIADKLKRGKIECSLSYKKQAVYQNFSVNAEAVVSLMQAVALIESKMPEKTAFSALDVLAFPGIQQETEADKAQLQIAITELLDKTVEALLANRRREGEQIAQLLIDRCQKMEQLTIAARQRMPEVLTSVRSKLHARINELVAEPNYDRLEQELVLLAQKLDVDEELDRLVTHIAEVKRALQQSEPIGRRLDFLMQEMNREANTLGSKSADREMTQISIDLKVLIEQMREQIQNVE